MRRALFKVILTRLSPVMLGFVASTGGASGTFTDWSSRFAEPIELKLEVAWDGVVDFRVHDFDGDGFTDLLFADRRGLWVCWGRTGRALGEARALLNPEGGISQIAFDDGELGTGYPSLLWLKVGQPAGHFTLQSYRFMGRQLQLFRELPHQIQGQIRCTGNGLMMGEIKGGELLLERHGVTLRLGKLKGHVTDLDFVDVDGDGWEDVVAEIDGDLFAALGHERQGLGTWELIAKGGLDSWDVAIDDHGRPGILTVAAGREHRQFRRKEGERWVIEDHETKKGARVINQHSAWYDGAALMHNPVTNLVFVMPLDGQDTYHGIAPLMELPEVGRIRLEDWDGDGDDDLVALNEADRTLTWVPYIGPGRPSSGGWSRWVTQRTGTLGAPELDLPLTAQPLWKRGLNWDSVFHEWLLAESGIWGLGEGRAVRRLRQSSEDVSDAPEDAAVSGSAPCLHISYLDYATNRRPPCLGFRDDKEWHRVTYTRGKFGETSVLIDGELAFEGYSSTFRYDHRMLFLGARFGQEWAGFSPVEMDDVSIYRGWLPADALQDWLASGGRPVNLQPVLEFHFDDEQPVIDREGRATLKLESSASFVPHGGGRSLRFDGKSGRAHVFANIPEDEITVDFNFKLHGPVTDNALVGLYGMYNLYFSLNLKEPMWGVVRSPELFAVEDQEDVRGGYLFTHGGSVLRMLPSGEWMRPVANGWELMRTDRLPFGWAIAPPWVQHGKVFAAFGLSGQIWQLEDPSEGWERLGELDLDAVPLDHVASTDGWAFTWSEGFERTGWLDLEGNAYYPASRATIPATVVAVRPGTGGVELLDERGNWWLVEAPSLSTPHHPALRKPSGWLMGMTAAAGTSLIGFALWHRKRGRLSVKDAEKESERKLPLSVQFVARQLQPKAGCTIEVQELDDLLGLAGLETDETRRSRRNRAINDVNDWSTRQLGVEWIRRLRDPNDRRRGLYHISQELADLDFSNSAD